MALEAVEGTDEIVQQVSEERVPLSMSDDDCSKATGPPNWLCSALPKQQPTFGRQFKWCGCVADSQCTHFCDSYDITTSSASIASSCPKWIPQFAHGTPHHQGTATRSSDSGDHGTGPDQFTAQDPVQNAKLKVDIISHHLYEQLLAAHVGCLRIATPVDHLPSIDAQLANTQQLSARYSISGRHVAPAGDEKEELDHVMASYIYLLQSFKEQLHEHVRVHAMEAVLACWELEQSLVKLTGVSPGEGSADTMSDDENDYEDNELCYIDSGLYDGHDNFGFGPLIPTETERSLIERVRQELKLELKQGYRSRIADVREEILRKRRAGKLPGETTSVLKRWWNAHSKWPYPTEDEKARLVHETGLELKQINNWFINQRKRNWHNHSISSSTPKSDVTRMGQTFEHVSLSLGSQVSHMP